MAARRLRIGYISADFRDHVIGRNILPLLIHHDREAFEIFCYSDVHHPDVLTNEFQKRAEIWRPTAGQPNHVVARQIQADRIDILVDLAQHVPGNRLTLFALRPAPVQISFAGYPEGAGLPAIGYRLSDPWLEPGDHPIDPCGCRVIQLPSSFWCYGPFEPTPAVTDLPARHEPFTFGCLNNFCKVNEPTLRVWARVMRQVERSRLVLMAKPGSHRKRVTDLLGSLGIDPGRVRFERPCGHADYLRLYHRIDLALDTFPYNGHTTSLDGLWMGVPAVSRYGDLPVSRAGLSQLSNLGLQEWAVADEESFIERAVDLARDRDRLSEMRLTLRQRVAGSSLHDARKFAQNIEAACRVACDGILTPRGGSSGPSHGGHC